ncbi:hypothetical protein L9F63_026563, partial [Diploptera punctata]
QRGLGVVYTFFNATFFGKSRFADSFRSLSSPRTCDGGWSAGPMDLAGRGRGAKQNTDHSSFATREDALCRRYLAGRSASISTDRSSIRNPRDVALPLLIWSHRPPRAGKKSAGVFSYLLVFISLFKLWFFFFKITS